MCAKHGGVPQAATGLSAAREEAERQRALDKSHTPIFWMFLNDSPDGLSFLTELLLRVERALDIVAAPLKPIEYLSFSLYSIISIF